MIYLVLHAHGNEICFDDTVGIMFSIIFNESDLGRVNFTA